MKISDTLHINKILFIVLSFLLLTTILFIVYEYYENIFIQKSISINIDNQGRNSKQLEKKTIYSSDKKVVFYDNPASSIDYDTRYDYDYLMDTASADEVAQYFMEALGSDNPKDRTIAIAFERKLRKEDSKEIYSKIEMLLESGSLPVSQQHSLVHLLAEAETYAAIEILLNIILEDTNPELSTLTLRFMSKMNGRIHGKYLTENSYLLESAWNKTTEARELKMIARLISKIGTESGLNMLLGELEGSRWGRKDDIIMESMQFVNNPEVITLLSENIKNYNTKDDDVFSASGYALSSIGTVESAQELLNWAVNAPSEALPFAKKWFKRVSGGGIKASNFLEREVPIRKFRSDILQQGILNAIESDIQIIKTGN